MANRSVSVSLRAEVASFVQGMAVAGRSVKTFASELDGMGTKSPKQLNDVAFAAAGIGAALLGVAGYAVKTAMDFDKQMSAVSAATKASAADMNLLREAALQAGKDTIFSATGAAQAQTELAKAGVSVRDILGGGLKGSLDLAAAGQMEVGEAAEIAATAMTQFGLAGAQLPHVADLLAAGAGKAQGEVHDMGLALKQSGLVANQFGISIEEMTGTLAAFASAGLIGSDAGTSFKQMLLQLANPSKKAATLMDDLGISAYDTGGQFVGVAGLAEQLKDKMSGLTQEQRNAALATIFGSDAIRAANVLYQQGGKGIDDWTNAVNDQGFAADQAARKTDNLAGDMERLKGSFETLAIEAGSGANSGLRLLVQGLDGVVTGFSNLPGPVQASLTILAGVGGVSLLAVAGLLKIKQTADDAMSALRDMGPAGSKAADGLGKAASWAGRAGLAIGAFALAWEGAQLLGKLTGYDEQTKVVTRDIDKMTTSLEKLATTGKTTGELKKAFGDDMSGLRKQAEALGELSKQYQQLKKDGEGLAGAILGAGGGGPRAGTAALDKQIGDIKANFDAVDKGLANLVNNGNATAAKIALQDIAKAAGMSVDELLAKMPAYRAAADGAAAANTGLAQGFGTAEQNARTMADSLNAAVQAGQSLKQVFDQLNGANINLVQAQINAEAAVDNLSAALKASAGSLDVTSEAGRKASSAALDLAQKGRDVAQSTYEQTGSVEQARTAFEGYRKQLIDSIATAGGTRAATDATRAAARQLADQIMSMPAFKKIDVALNDDATWKILGIKSQLNSLQNKVVTVTTRQNVVTGEVSKTVHAGPRFERWGGAYEHAQVGLLRDASIYSPNGPARYAFAEPATGGEAFIPRRGDYGRSMSILSRAAGWYGATVNTGNSGGGAVTNVSVVVNAGLGTNGHEVGRQIAEQLRPFIRTNGGNVQLALAGRPAP